MSHDFSLGSLHAGLAQSISCIALAWHIARGNTPIRVTLCVYDIASHYVAVLAVSVGRLVNMRAFVQVPQQGQAQHCDLLANLGYL